MWSDAGSFQEQFDIVHATAFPYSLPIVCGLRMARRQRIPFLLTPFLHIGDPADPHDRTRRQYLSPALVWLLRQASAIVVQTHLERAAVLASGIAKDKVILLGMGVSPEECTGGNRQRARRDWLMTDKEIAIGHLANNSEEKGTVDLLRAAELAWGRNSRFKVILAGPEMPNFRKFFRNYSSAGRVQRLGVLNDVQKRDFFAGIDVFALPSRSDSFGLVLLEAWANAVPNIAYRAGGIAEVIRNNVDGLLVACGDVRGLADALINLSNDRELCRRLGLAGNARVPTEFQWKDKLDRISELYGKMTGGREQVPNLLP
jgi:glycosyltransferase involved in cell wall biosynthesis